MTAEQRQSFKDQHRQIDNEDRKECADKINALLKEYGYTYDILIDYNALAQKLISEIKSAPRQLILKGTP